MKLTTLISVAFLAQSSLAHPGESAAQHARDAAERRAYLANNKRSLAHCDDTLKARGNDITMHARRSAMVEKLRAKRAIAQDKPYLRIRDLDTVLATDHKSNMTGVTANTDPATLFAGNNSCILTPEVTQGPYWVEGELVREDVTENQEGIPMTLDIQIIDVNTCEPVPQAYLEMWHCNATGVYSGVVAQGNGVGEDDESNLQNTALRGIQQSDENGVVVFQTIFPGHYTGRATHIHVMSRLNATVNANSTLSGGHITHVGQMFFDQDLITLADTVEPYASNEQELTSNSDDSILAEEAEDVDPFVEYVMLGDDISEGLFGWLAFGMDSTNSYNITPAAYWTEEGGVENENSGGMGGGPGGAPNGTMPSGTVMPTGAMPSGNAVESGMSTTVVSSLSTAVASSAASSVASEITPGAAGVTMPSDAPQGGHGRGKGHQDHANEEKQRNRHNTHVQGQY
ncbi:extracellular dioxygenase [Alternaria burnsii]|uniref:Extracellular dioxygenase n=1 Tax=Alternaria burnsii TaxID=1187904 RepID=A0A8H7B888_9PLEO|nr:extracellular dioxygenase [Alternaria burnsii]KAF7678220.1 extracellular dioxygenase [Alternaria burnsii]